MKLFLMEDFVQHVLEGASKLKDEVEGKIVGIPISSGSSLYLTKSKDLNSADSFFINEVNRLLEATKEWYDVLKFREALKTSFFALSRVVKEYRMLSGADSGRGGMNIALILEYLRAQAIILSPIAPHLCEHIWTSLRSSEAVVSLLPMMAADRALSGRESLVSFAKWPQPLANKGVDLARHQQYSVMWDALEDFRKDRSKAVDQQKKAANKGGKKKVDVPAPADASAPPSGKPHVGAVIYVAKEYTDWQQSALAICRDTITMERDTSYANEGDANWLMTKGSVDGVREKLQHSFASNKPLIQQALSFAVFQINEAKAAGPAAFEAAAPFDEAQLFASFTDFIKETLELDDLTIWSSAEAHPTDKSERRQKARPLHPVISVVVSKK
eukprot:Selendium_serpulae@DN6149_c0_g1_i10.p1